MTSEIQIEEASYIEQKKVPRKYWWDEDCENRLQTRKAEKQFRRFRNKVLSDLRKNKELSSTDNTCLKELRKKYFDCLRNLRDLRKNKEKKCRYKLRGKLLGLGVGSKEFWRKLSMVDIDKCRKNQNKQVCTDVPLNDFYMYFKSISSPPTCDWFDNFHANEVELAIKQSLYGINVDAVESTLDDNAYKIHLIPECFSVPEENRDKFMKAFHAFNSPFSIDELRKVKKKLKLGKSTGLDNFSVEVFRGRRISKKGPLISPFDDILLHLFNSILMSGKFPWAWRIALLVPIFKKGDKSMPSNYRGIALLSVLCKMFANLIEQRMSAFQASLNLIADEQFGFTRNRRTQDPIFILNTLIERAKHNNEKLYVAFIDFQKAYDFVYRSGLFFKM